MARWPSRISVWATFETELLGLPDDVSVNCWNGILRSDISGHCLQTQFTQSNYGERNFTAISSQSFCSHATGITTQTRFGVLQLMSSNISSNSGLENDEKSFEFTTLGGNRTIVIILKVLHHGRKEEMLAEKQLQLIIWSGNILALTTEQPTNDLLRKPPVNWTKSLISDVIWSDPTAQTLTLDRKSVV